MDNPIPEWRSNSVAEIWMQGSSERFVRSVHATQQQMQVPLSGT